MPLNTLRLNHQPSTHPNERIVFIKPISRPASQKQDYDRAELVLKAISAQCLPVMKNHHLSVTTLEEYEPNPEFIGRNFNNGEIIQLVLQSKCGSWLPLNMIQMVMMHELAHNTHMNHGRDFWKARNLYAGEMQQLWSRGYTGEGLWGPGRTMETVGQALGNNVVRNEELANLPLCGGTFRSRRKKRKAKGQDLTWKEKRDKRIEKKFGKNGESLGEDEDKRLSLEINGKIKGSLGSKPRVAQSKRGRELRAAAALARFETNKTDFNTQQTNVTSADDDAGTETESEYEEADAEQSEARDIDGRKILDSQGNGMIRVCQRENGDDSDVQNEMQELIGLDSMPGATPASRLHREPVIAKATDDAGSVSREERNPGTVVKPDTALPIATGTVPREEKQRGNAAGGQKYNPSTNDHKIGSTHENSAPNNEVNCSVCSMANGQLRATCIACSHVLDVRKDPRHWRCTSDACKGTEYINSGDCGICGICGRRKPS